MLGKSLHSIVSSNNLTEVNLLMLKTRARLISDILKWWQYIFTSKIRQSLINMMLSVFTVYEYRPDDALVQWCVITSRCYHLSVYKQRDLQNQNKWLHSYFNLILFLETSCSAAPWCQDWLRGCVFTKTSLLLIYLFFAHHPH